MVQKLDPDQVVGFAFMPIGNRPDASDRIHLRELSRLIALPAGEFDFHDQRMRMAVARKMIDHFDVWFVGELLGLGGIGFEVIDAAQVVQMIERQRGNRSSKTGRLPKWRTEPLPPKDRWLRGSPR